MEKETRIRFRFRDGWLEVIDEVDHKVLLNMEVSGVDRDKLSDVVGEIIRHHFFVWCP